MSEFMLLLEETPADFAAVSAEQMQDIIERYVAWRQAVEASGRRITGHKLKDEGGKRLARQAGALSVTDGAYAEAKEVIGGIFIIEADSYDEAVRIAADCPHADYGRITVREIERVG